MQMRITWYDRGMTSGKVDRNDPEALDAWHREYLLAVDALEKALGVVLALAAVGARDSHDLCDDPVCPGCAQVDAALDLVLDACPPAVLAHFDALVAPEEDR